MVGLMVLLSCNVHKGKRKGKISGTIPHTPEEGAELTTVLN